MLYDDRVCAHHKDEEQQHLHDHDVDLVPFALVLHALLPLNML